MAQLDRPIWVHPTADLKNPAYDGGMFVWPYESSRFMLDIVRAGIFEEFPDIKIIIHHAGGMVPHYRERVRTSMKKHGDKYFKYFYTDTALYGNTPGLMSAFDYFGADHMLFGTDSPLGGPVSPSSNGNTEQTIRAIEHMAISDEDKEKIYYGNAIKLFVVPA
jgi:predicted TIM-barrel fold metal-dependent hydrolase